MISPRFDVQYETSHLPHELGMRLMGFRHRDSAINSRVRDVDVDVDVHVHADAWTIISDGWFGSRAEGDDEAGAWGERWLPSRIGR